MIPTLFTSLTVRQGETLSSIVFALTNPDGTPYNLSGCSAHMSVRSMPSDASPLVDFTDANGGLIFDVLAGTVTLVASAATTAAWTASVYEFDLFVTFSDSARQCIAYGTFFVVASNTRIS